MCGQACECFAQAIRYGGPMDPIDDFDQRILAILARDSRQTGEQLSEQVGLSPAACLRRVQRLRKIGAIEREVAILSPKVIGPSVTVLVLLRMRGGGPDRKENLKTKLLALPQVERIYIVTGNEDMVVTVQCASMEDYADFTETHFYDQPITGFESLVVLREYKKGT